MKPPLRYMPMTFDRKIGSWILYLSYQEKSGLLYPLKGREMYFQSNALSIKENLLLVI